MKNLIAAVALLALSFLWTGNASAAGSCTAGCVQWTSGIAFGGTSTTETFGSAVTAGHTILVPVCVTAGTLTFVSVLDSVNTYVPIGQNTVGNNYNCTLYYALNVAAGTPTITVTVSGAVGGLNIWAEEWAGLVTVSALDGSNAADTAGSGTAGDAWNSGSFTTTASGDLVWGFAFISNGSGAAQGSGFAVAVNDNADSYFSEFLTQGAAGSISATFTAVGGAFDYYAVGAAFKKAGGGGVSCKHLSLLHAGC